MSVEASGQKVLCLYSAETRAFDFAERTLDGQPGVDWQTAGAEHPEILLEMSEDGPRRGFDGWVLDPPLEVEDDLSVSSWQELREEVERKIEVGAAWGSPPPSLPELPLDSETDTLMTILPSAVEVLRSPSSPYQAPQWIEDFQRGPQQLEFMGKEGSDTLEQWLKQTEERVAALFEHRPRSLLHMLAVLRRLPNDRFFLGEMEEEGSTKRFNPFQANVAERTILKHARRSADGVETEGWCPGLSGLAVDKPSVNAEVLAEVWALAQHAGVGLAHVDNMRKTVVRGGKVILRTDGMSDARQEDPGLQQRLNLYDRRRAGFSFVGAAAGTFHPSDVGSEPGERSAPRVMRISTREDEGSEWWGYDISKRRIRKWDKRFKFSVLDLDPAYEYMALLQEEVSSQYGLTPEEIVSALTAIDRMVVHFLAPDGTPEELLPERIAHLDRRGYLLIREDVLEDVILGRWMFEAHREAFPKAPEPDDPENLVASFKRLAYLDAYNREDLSVIDGSPWVPRAGSDGPVPMPPPFVYPAGDHRLIDLNNLNDFVQGLFECLVLDEQPRQTVAGELERRLGAYFGDELDHQRAFEPSRKLYVRPPGQNRRPVAELDASFKIGSVLVAIDAKSIRVSSDYRRYEHSALRTRWEKFEDYVRHADEQADKLAQQPVGTNYDLITDGYTHIVTLLCSAMPEYIDTEDSSFYIRSDLPRVATPLELRDFLGETTEDELRALPFAKTVDG